MPTDHLYGIVVGSLLFCIMMFGLLSISIIGSSIIQWILQIRKKWYPRTKRHAGMVINRNIEIKWWKVFFILTTVDVAILYTSGISPIFALLMGIVALGASVLFFYHAIVFTNQNIRKYKEEYGD